MDDLNANARTLLVALAYDHGVPALEPDADGLIPIDFDGETVALGFSAMWDSAFLVAVLASDAAALVDAYRPFRLGTALAPRNTRIGLDPDSNALVLTREIALQGLGYPDFNAALGEYVADLAMVRAGLAVG